MSEDSSKEHPVEPKESPKKWWHIFRLRDDWGVVMGIVVSGIALIATWFLLSPLFEAIMPHVVVSLNVKIAIITGAIMFVGMLIIAAALAAYNKKFRDIGLGKPRLHHFAKAFMALFAYIAVSLVLQIIVKALFGQGYNADEAQNLGYSALSGVETAVVFVCLVVLVPVVEEVIFRGFMFRGIRRHFPFWFTAVLVSFLFGLVHGQWNVGLDVFAMSLISCYLVEKSGSLWPSIFLHVLKNGLAFYIVYLYNGG